MFTYCSKGEKRVFSGVEHFAIAARDTELLAKWYCDNLGFRTVYRNTKTPPTYFIKSSEGSMIEIIPANEKDKIGQGSTDPGLRHLAITVSDFEKAYAYLKEKRVRSLGEPKEASGGVKVAYFADIEDNIIHIIFRPNPL